MASTKEPVWLTVARAELARGVREVPGAESNPQIDEYHDATAAGAPAQDGDATAWCSSFVNWCLKKAGIVGTRRKSARSWLGWGRGIVSPVPGCVVVLWRVTPKSSSGHVGFFVGHDSAGNLLLLGGNQGNRVSIRAYPPSRVLGYRMPEAA